MLHLVFALKHASNIVTLLQMPQKDFKEDKPQSYNGYGYFVQRYWLRTVGVLCTLCSPEDVL